MAWNDYGDSGSLAEHLAVARPRATAGEIQVRRLASCIRDRKPRRLASARTGAICNMHRTRASIR